VGPALAVGCTAVVKPSELTPLTALALHQLAVEAGLPDGCLEMVTANRHQAAAVGEAFCRAEHVRKLSFTGSTAVGKLLMEQCSSTVKRLSLELGGNAPFIVFQDADLEQAVKSAVASKFRNAGQTCVCADRFLIHERVHDEFVDKFCRVVESLHVGPGLDASTNFGPLINQAAVESVDAKVKEAIQEGAICRTGGKKLQVLSNDDDNDEMMPSGGHFYAPTMLTNVSLQSRIWATETFGPVAAIRSFATEEEALAIANDSPVGLAGYFCTKDMSRVFRFGRQ
jgi:succinate-semialdehyde dehydrogenase / glutarate-semialdehyde dehydrogenase